MFYMSSINSCLSFIAKIVVYGKKCCYYEYIVFTLEKPTFQPPTDDPRTVSQLFLFRLLLRPPLKLSLEGTRERPRFNEIRLYCLHL